MDLYQVCMSCIKKSVKNCLGTGAAEDFQITLPMPYENRGRWNIFTETNRAWASGLLSGRDNTLAEKRERERSLDMTILGKDMFYRRKRNIRSIV